MIRIIRLALTVTVALAAVSACMMDPGGDAPPPGQDWFGNPVPTAESCAARPPVPRERPPYDPASGGRPAVVPPGWRWMVITLRVHAVLVNPVSKFHDINHCVPIRVHVYAQQQYNPSPIKMNTGTGEVTNLPYDGVQVTPWLTSYFIFAFNPETYDHEIPPEYKIDFIATWDGDFDTTGAKPPTHLICHIGIAGGYDVARAESNPTARGRKTADCKYRNHLYWS